MGERELWAGWAFSVFPPVNCPCTSHLTFCPQSLNLEEKLTDISLDHASCLECSSPPPTTQYLVKGQDINPGYGKTKVVFKKENPLTSVLPKRLRAKECWGPGPSVPEKR